MGIERALVFANPRGQRLAGVWHEPDGAPDRAVVVAHGLLSGKDSAKHREVCARVAAGGVAALRFDFAGRGSSEGSLAGLTVSGEIEDLRAAIATARSLGVRDVGLIGSSLGGAVSILVAASDPEIACLATMAAPARLPRAPRPSWEPILDPERGESLGSAFFADAARHDIAGAATRIRMPWLILHGADDEVVPVTDAHLLAAANAGAGLEVHPEADHRFSRPEQLSWLIGRVTEFVLQRGGQRGQR